MSGGIPFTIRGTASSPQFVPEMSHVAQSAVQGILQGNGGVSGSPLDSLTGLFERKKKK